MSNGRKLAPVCAANAKREAVNLLQMQSCLQPASQRKAPANTHRALIERHNKRSSHTSSALQHTVEIVLPSAKQPADRRDGRHAHCTNANLKPYGCHMNDDCDTCSEQNTRGHTDQKRVAGIVKQKAEDEQTARRRTANIKVIDLTSPSSQKEG